MTQNNKNIGRLDTRQEKLFRQICSQHGEEIRDSDDDRTDRECVIEHEVQDGTIGYSEEYDSILIEPLDSGRYYGHEVFGKVEAIDGNTVVFGEGQI